LTDGTNPFRVATVRPPDAAAADVDAARQLVHRWADGSTPWRQ
jgi:hypothetical protein